MDVGEGSSKTSTSSIRDDVIQAGHTVLLRLPSGEVKTVKLEKKNTVSIGKFGSFHSDELIGQPFGLTYEITNKKLKVVPPRTILEVAATDATNELINDDQFVQPLTAQEIETLKKSGANAQEIIKVQIEQHANYSLKTEYSKEKYKKRKEAKFSKSFTVIDPTLFNVCEYWFNKDPARMRDIRIDSLSQMLNLANIRPGGRYLAVDDASGIVIAGILDRLGGSGRLISICDLDSPPAYPAVVHMNFKKEAVASVMSSLNWATADEEYTPILPPNEPAGKIKSDGQKSRLNKRKATSATLMQTRDELFAGEFDGLIVASEYEPLSVLEKLSPYLAGSASIVVHSPYVQVAADLQSKLRDRPEYLGAAVTEVWTRQYQVLPGRTHPTMNTSGSGGFIMHTIKVYDDPSASSVMAHRRKAKKVKLDESRATSTSSAAEGLSTPASPKTEQVSEHMGVKPVSVKREGTVSTAS